MIVSAEKRAYGLDLIKTLAIFFVICVHFSLNTAYYTTPVAGFNMLIQTVFRWLFVSCVPLFILSTGFLSGSKTEIKGHYPKLLRVVIPYILICVLCLIVQAFRNPGPFSLKKAVFSIFSFNADPYAWYVNMFIGLFLLMPYINRLLFGLEKKSFHILLIVMTLLFLLPQTFNPIFAYSDKFAFFYFPDFWSAVYPLFYYAAGAYIARFRPVIKARWCLLAVAATVLLQTLVLVIAQPYIQNNWLLTNYGSVLVAAQSVALFLLLYRAEIKNNAARRILPLISSVTLEIYLFSYLADSTIYPYLYKLSGGITQQEFYLRYFIVAVPAVFVSSLAAALLLHIVYTSAAKLLKRVFKRPEKIPAVGRR